MGQFSVRTLNSETFFQPMTTQFPTDTVKAPVMDSTAEPLTDDEGRVIQYDQLPGVPGTQKLVYPKAGESAAQALARIESDPRVQEVVVTDSGLVFGRRVPVDLARDLKERALMDLMGAKATRDLARLIVLAEAIEGQRAIAQSAVTAVHELIVDVISRVDGYAEYMQRVNNQRAHAITGNTANELYQRQIASAGQLPQYNYERLGEAQWKAKLRLGAATWTAIANSKARARDQCAAQALGHDHAHGGVVASEDQDATDAFAAVLAARRNRDMHALHGNTSSADKLLRTAMEQDSRDDSGAARNEPALVKAKTETVVPVKESPLAQLMSNIGKPGYTSIVGSARQLATAGYAASADVKVTIREQDTEHMLNVTGGHHWLTENYRDAVPATVAINWHSFMVRPIAWKEPTVAVNLLPLYSTAMTVVDGADPGAVSSPLRMNLTTIVGNLNLMHAQLCGDNVRKNIGTSTADVALRCLLSMFSMSMIDNGGDLIVANHTWQPANPPVITHNVGVNWFPLSPNSIAAGPLPGNTITGVVASLDTFLQVAIGTATPVVGFEPSTWGVTRGTAIVPMRSSWLLDGPVNSAWTCAFLEYPQVWYHCAGQIVDTAAGAPILNPCSATPATQYVRVPGPWAHVIYVLTDVENQVPASVRVGRGVVATMTAAAHNLVGGAALGLSASFADYWTNALHHDEAFVALGRWNQLFGNEHDWWSAWFTAIDVYARHSIKPRRRTNTGELLYWNDEVAAPFVDNGLGYAAPTAANIGHFGGLCTSASGCRGGAAAPAQTTTDTFVISAGVPLIYVGLAARFYRCATPLTFDLNVGTEELAMRAARDADTMAVCFDWLVQQFQMQERVVMDLGGLANGADARMWWSKLTETWWQLTKDIGVRKSYKPLWTFNDTQNADYEAECPNSLDSAPFSRMPTQYLARLGRDVLPHDDFITATMFGYRIRNMNPGGGALDFDVLQRVGLTEFLEMPELGVQMRKLLTVGGFTVALTDITTVALCDEAGGWVRYISIPFEHPTSGRSWEWRHELYRQPARRSDVREIIHSCGPALLDTQTGNRMLKVALSGARAVTAGDGRYLPIMVTRGSLGMVTGAPTRDTTSLSPAALAGTMIFRV